MDLGLLSLDRPLDLLLVTVHGGKTREHRGERFFSQAVAQQQTGGTGVPYRTRQTRLQVSETVFEINPKLPLETGEVRSDRGRTTFAEQAKAFAHGATLLDTALQKRK